MTIKSRLAILKAEPDLSQLLLEKGFITELEYFTKLKQVQGEYERKKRALYIK
jgi:hypothetical protein